MKKNETDHGNVAAIAILCLCLIAVTGLGVWHVAAKKTAQHPPTAQTTVKTSQKPENGAKSAADPSESGRYLVIAEWGVKFELSESIRGDIYYRAYHSDELGEDGVIFGSKRLDAAVTDGSCSIAPHKDGTTGPGLSSTLTRIKPKDKSSETLAYYRAQRTLLTQAEGYEYYYVRPSKDPLITCVTEHPEQSVLEKATRESLVAGFSGLKPINK